MASVLVPALYLVLVIGSLLIFGSFYRRSAAKKRIEPYFPSHPARDTYMTLIQRDPPPPDAVLKAALVNRAMTDVTRVIRVREDKAALQNLLQKGSIGDELWASFLAAENEMQAEVLDVVAEANTFVEGWGQIIFETAGQMLANEKMRAMYESTAQARAEKQAIYGKKVAVPSAVAPSAPSAEAASPDASSPVTTSKVPNGLTVPASAIAESFASSDGEGLTSPASPRSPYKSSGKKGKRRK